MKTLNSVAHTASRMLRKGLLLIAVSLTASFAPAQAQEGGGNNSGGQQQQPSPEQQQRQEQHEQQQRRAQEQQERQRQQQVWNMIVRGNVLLASGGAPSEPVRIQYVCGTQASETLSDSKGRFTVFVQQQEYGFQDASLAGQHKNRTAGGGCMIQAVASGFRSSTITESGTIILTPLGDAEGSVISVTSLAAPKRAKALLFKAVQELGEGPSANLDKAMKDLQKAIDEYPEYAAAWTKLGQVRAQSGDSEGAIAALEESVELDKRYVLPYDALVRLYMGKRDWDHATELAQFALGINPADTAMRWYQAVCSFETGRDDDAIKLIGEVLEDPEAASRFPQTQRIMGLIYAKRGEYAEAAAAFKRYLEGDPDGPAVAVVQEQLSEWERLGVI